MRSSRDVGCGPCPRGFVPVLLLALVVVWCSAVGAAARQSASSQPNIVFILIDDQRFDSMSALGHPFLETPNLDRLMAEGTLYENAFVTTSLCSPSRASILTGQYAHRHQVLANRTPLDPATPTFAQVIDRAGYRTAFVGKWHMGAPNDSPRPGFDRWVSFPGQGRYFDQVLNVDGASVASKGYVTDVLTDYAVEFLAGEPRGDGQREPFLLYLSHKAVHSDFAPAPRHRGSYSGREFPHPPSMVDTEANYRGKPDWVRAQRDSWHGVDGMYNNRVDFDQFARDYAETMRAVDDSVGRVLDALEKQGVADNTVVIFTSDNGFQFGEHGLIDKRTMYEASIRVPLLVRAPMFGAQDKRRSEMILNIDFAPTLIELAGAEIPASVQGRSFLPLLEGTTVEWRDAFLYEYFWERAFPQTPTVLGVRTDRYKLMRYQGIWDRYELYDLEKDPDERNNLLGEFKTRREIGNVEARVRGGSNPIEQSYLGVGTDDEELEALFFQLSKRLDELIEETGALPEPVWSR